MGVLVSLQRGMSPGAYLEVANLAGKIRLRIKEDLARDILENAPVLLVGEDGNGIPAEIAVMLSEHHSSRLASSYAFCDSRTASM